MEQGYENQIAAHILEMVNDAFNKYVTSEFDGSIPAFVNRFIATDSGMFSDIRTYSERFSNAMSTECYGIYLMNIYISRNYKPVFELIFRMHFEAKFPKDLHDLDNFTESYDLVYEITRNDKDQWSIEKHVDDEAYLDALSAKDFFLLKSKITDPDIY